jgi:acyl phosphate:glycerol-3-phosphate acyltransferase
VILALVALALGYLVGSFPSAALAARSRGLRIFEVGSGNMGAMNTARNLGIGWGVAVFAADVGKGALAAAAGSALARAADASDLTLTLALCGGVGAVVGHAWSPFVGFRGGKALAAAFGATLPVYPVAGLVVAAVLVALTLALWPRHHLASIIAVTIAPFLAYLVTARTADPERALAVLAALLVSCAVILVKHRPSRRAAA